MINNIKNIIKAGTSYVGAIVNGNTTTESEYNSRKSICMSCVDVDSNGDCLFRCDDICTCGTPYLEHMWGRDEVQDGCGCDLSLKWGSVDHHCPRGYW